MAEEPNAQVNVDPKRGETGDGASVPRRCYLIFRPGGRFQGGREMSVPKAMCDRSFSLSFCLAAVRD